MAYKFWWLLDLEVLARCYPLEIQSASLTLSDENVIHPEARFSDFGRNKHDICL